jgi:hypothetical protein
MADSSYPTHMRSSHYSQMTYTHHILLLLVVLVITLASQASCSDWRAARNLPNLDSRTAPSAAHATGGGPAGQPYAAPHSLLREEALRSFGDHREDFNLGAHGHVQPEQPGGVSGGWGFTNTGNPHVTGGRWRTNSHG